MPRVIASFAHKDASASGKVRPMFVSVNVPSSERDNLMLHKSVAVVVVDDRGSRNFCTCQLARLLSSQGNKWCSYVLLKDALEE